MLSQIVLTSALLIVVELLFTRRRVLVRLDELGLEGPTDSLATVVTVLGATVELVRD